MRIYTVMILSVTTILSCSSEEKQLSKQLDDKSNLGLNLIYDAGDTAGRPGDIIEFDILQKSGDKILTNTFEIPGYTARAILKKPEFPGDYMEGLRILGPGDSAIFQIARTDLPEAMLNRLPEIEDDLSIIVKVRAIWNEQELIEGLVSHLKRINEGEWKKTSKGLRIFWDERGDGKQVEFGDSVFIHVRSLFTTGVPFFDSRESGQLISFKVGESAIRPLAWEEATLLMSEGDKVTVISPYSMAYGELDRKPVLKYTTLVFEIDLIEVRQNNKL